VLARSVHQFASEHPGCVIVALGLTFQALALGRAAAVAHKLFCTVAQLRAVAALATAAVVATRLAHATIGRVATFSQVAHHPRSAFSAVRRRRKPVCRLDRFAHLAIVNPVRSALKNALQSHYTLAGGRLVFAGPLLAFVDSAGNPVIARTARAAATINTALGAVTVGAAHAFAGHAVGGIGGAGVGLSRVPDPLVGALRAENNTILPGVAVIRDTSFFPVATLALFRATALARIVHALASVDALATRIAAFIVAALQPFAARGTAGELLGARLRLAATSIAASYSFLATAQAVVQALQPFPALTAQAATLVVTAFLVGAFGVANTVPVEAIRSFAITRSALSAALVVTALLAVALRIARTGPCQTVGVLHRAHATHVAAAVRATLLVIAVRGTTHTLILDANWGSPGAHSTLAAATVISTLFPLASRLAKIRLYLVHLSRIYNLHHVGADLLGIRVHVREFRIRLNQIRLNGRAIDFATSNLHRIQSGGHVPRRRPGRRLAQAG